ncbi:MAG TPA: helicase [Myxococcales bacterium]|nr:helicase [Myxococcales bacterium]
MSSTNPQLDFVHGTLELRGVEPVQLGLDGWQFDPRAGCYRADGNAYRAAALALHRQQIPWNDQARKWTPTTWQLYEERTPRPYQTEALDAWRSAQGNGVVVLPTGAGKTWLAVMAMHAVQRPTLVVAPTLDLVRQWHGLLRSAFQVEVGVVGGGDHQVTALTVTTYDSAWLHMEFFGDRFGLVVFDEVHHLPGASYCQAATMSMAPFRLGLTATPEREDGGHAVLDTLVGPVAYRRDIVELSGRWLAEYDVERIEVALSDDERQRWQAARETYRSFLRDEQLRLGGPNGWSRFIARASRSERGREALRAYREQRRLALSPEQKYTVVGTLLHQHRNDRCLIFTADNATAHQLSRQYLVPAITHQTKVTERTQILEDLREGTLRAVVTSRVLNEGVDVPEANVAIVVSGSGTVREHVQRLGRVLRKRQGKRAILYELVTADTAEMNTSNRRRHHSAYRDSALRDAKRES